MPNKETRSWKDRLVLEVKKLFLTVIYLWVLFSVFVLHRAMILAEFHISDTQRLGFAFVNALILAKFILIAEAFHAGEKAESKPLLYSILFKSAVFSAILMVCHILEEVLVGLWHGKAVAQSLPEMSGAALSQIVSLGIIMFVVLIPFFAAKELSRVLGKSELKLLLLSRPTSTSTAPSKV